jgi:hypothetical protein
LKDAAAAVELHVRACGKRRRRMMLWWAEPRRHRCISGEDGRDQRPDVFFLHFRVGGGKGCSMPGLQGYFGQSNDVEAKCLHQLQTNSKDLIFDFVFNKKIGRQISDHQN